MPTDGPQVTVVVPARDAESGVEALLDALAGQTLAPAQVVVVDDASADATAAVARRHPIGAEVVARPHAGGSYAARNDGVRRARGAIVAFTDADCRPRPDWLERAVASLAAGADLVGGAVATTLSSRPTLAECVDVARGIDQERLIRLGGFAATANLVVRREVLDTVGPFNDRLRSGGDDEMCQRAVAAGFRLVYAADAVVEHDARRTPGALARKGFRVGYGFGQLRVHGQGPAADKPRRWRSPRALRPRRGLLGVEHLVAQGYDPGPVRRLGLDLVQYACVHLPELAGDVVATVRERRLGARR